MKIKNIALIALSVSALSLAAFVAINHEPKNAIVSALESYHKAKISVLSVSQCTELTADSLRLVGVLSKAIAALDESQKWIDLGGNQSKIDSLFSLAHLSAPSVDSLRTMQGGAVVGKRLFTKCLYETSDAIGIKDTIVSILNEKREVVYTCHD